VGGNHRRSCPDLRRSPLGRRGVPGSVSAEALGQQVAHTRGDARPGRTCSHEREPATRGCLRRRKASCEINEALGMRVRRRRASAVRGRTTSSGSSGATLTAVLPRPSQLVAQPGGQVGVSRVASPPRAPATPHGGGPDG
jgi:hypothetical protein